MIQGRRLAFSVLRPSHARYISLGIAAVLVASMLLSTFASQGAAVAAAAPVTAPPPSLPFADSAFETIWTRNDQPVASGAAQRSWTWGPTPLVAGTEAY